MNFNPENEEKEMIKLFKLSLFIGISALLFAGCAQVIDPECFCGGILGGGSNGYGGVEFFIEAPYEPALTTMTGDWLYDADNGDSEKINLNSDGSFALQSNFNDQNQINNGSYRHNDTQLELNINGYHYILNYSLAGGNLILSHEKGSFVFVPQNDKPK